MYGNAYNELKSDSYMQYTKLEFLEEKIIPWIKNWNREHCLYSSEKF